MTQISGENYAQLPELVYVTRQITDSLRMERPIHQHNDLTEILYVYHGRGRVRQHRMRDLSAVRRPVSRDCGAPQDD